MCVLIFSTVFVWNTCHSKKNSARCVHKCTSVSCKSTRNSCQVLMETGLPSVCISNSIHTRCVFQALSIPDRFSKNSHQITWKSVQLEPSCSVRTGGQTCMMKLSPCSPFCARARTAGNWTTFPVYTTAPPVDPGPRWVQFSADCPHGSLLQPLTPYCHLYPRLCSISFLSSALFCDITQRIVAIPYRRFGTTYRSQFEGPRISWPLYHIWGV